MIDSNVKWISQYMEPYKVKDFLNNYHINLGSLIITSLSNGSILVTFQGEEKKLV